MLVADILAQSVAQFGQRPALHFLGRSWSYRSLGALVDRAARGLQDLQVGPGVRVGLCLPNTPYYPIFYYAVLKVGGMVVNMNPLYAEREFTGMIADSGLSMMVVLDLATASGTALRAAAASGVERIVVCPMAGILPPVKAALFRLFKRGEVVAPDSRYVPYRAVVANPAQPAPVTIDPSAVAVLQYTGGTTGTPKGAMLTHANLTINCRQVLAHWSGARPGEERTLAVLPFFHVFAMTSVLNYSVMIGAEIVMLPRFDLQQVLATVARRGITIFHAVPTIYNAINSCGRRDEPGVDPVRRVWRRAVAQ